jgi:hypothetical protein
MSFVFDVSPVASDPIAGLYSLSSWVEPAMTLLLLTMIGVFVVLGVVAFMFWALQIFESPSQGPASNGKRMASDSRGVIRTPLSKKLHLRRELISHRGR